MIDRVAVDNTSSKKIIISSQIQKYVTVYNRHKKANQSKWNNPLW